MGTRRVPAVIRHCVLAALLALSSCASLDGQTLLGAAADGAACGAADALTAIAGERALSPSTSDAGAPP